MASPPLPSEIRRLLRRQQIVPGTAIPAYRLLDTLATEDGDVAKLIIYFKDMKEPAMRKAFHDMGALLRALERVYLGAAEAAPKPSKEALKRDMDALKAAREVKVFVDGASKGNPGPSAVAFVIADAEANSLYEDREPIGTATNNEAEYRALIAAMAKALALGKKRARFFSDSELVVNQVAGRWKIKKRELAALAGQVLELRSQFEHFSLAAIPRERNKRADILAASAIKADSSSSEPETADQPA